MKIGIDLIEVKRIARLVKDRHFLERIYTGQEIAYCRGKKKSAQHFAVRFATKEAVWKALGQDGIALRDIGVRNLPSGKPCAVIKGKLKKNIEISLSHTDEYATAVAIVK